MTYSLQLYTLRTALGEDLPGTIKRVADLGYTAVEPYNFVAAADELAAALPAHGLTAPSGHAPLLGADQDEIFEAARTLGIGGVPFFVLGGRYGVSGAQSPEVLRGALEQVWAETHPAPLTLLGTETPAQACEDGQCAVPGGGAAVTRG